MCEKIHMKQMNQNTNTDRKSQIYFIKTVQKRNI